MRKFTRGEFLGMGAALAGASALELLPFARAQAQQTRVTIEPDLVVIQARVYTMNPAQPKAEAFAIKNGRFVAIGSTSDVRNLATSRTKIIDAQRMTILPGFIDAHCHPSGVAVLYEVNTNLRSIREIQDALRERAEATPKGYWITGVMFDDTKLSEGRPLN